MPFKNPDKYGRVPIFLSASAVELHVSTGLGW